MQTVKKRDSDISKMLWHKRFGYVHESGTHNFKDISFAWPLVVYSQSVSGAEQQLLQVQSQRPGVMRVQSPDTEQGWATDGWWGEGPVEGLEESSTRPLDGSGSHGKLPLSWGHPSLLLCKQWQQIGLIIPLRTRIYSLLSVIFGPKSRLFIQCTTIFWQHSGSHGSITALFVCTTAVALSQTLHLAVAAPGEGQTPASQALKGCC